MIITSKNAEKDRAELINKIYKLGFEVGLKNHSEIGWVLREYDDLMACAKKLGIKSPDSHYADAKIKGKASRDKQVEGPKLPEKAAATIRKIDISDARIDSTVHREEINIDRPSQKPSINDLPNFVKKGSATEIPGLLEGFKPLKKK